MSKSSKSTDTSAPSWIIDATNTLEYTKRSEPVDYNEIKSKAVSLLGKEIAFAWGVSLNLESLKKKDGRSVTVKATTMTYDELLVALATQGSVAMKEGIADPSKRVGIAKDVVTPSRLARAFAVETIFFLSKKPSANPFKPILTKSNGASGEKLPTYYGFLNAIYGMSEEKLTENVSGLVAFYETFDAVISEAVLKGWQKDERGKPIEATASTNDNARSWSKAFEDFMEFHGFDHTSKTLLT